MVTMGLDISANSTGVVVLDSENPGNVLSMNFKPGGTGWERSIAHHDLFDTLLHTTEPYCAFIEDYAHGARGRTTMLVEIGTLYRYLLHEAGIPWTTINPKSLKKFVTDDGNADKKKMAKSVQARWQFINKSHDVVDAYALAVTGQLAILHARAPLIVTKREQEVLELIDIPTTVG